MKAILLLFLCSRLVCAAEIPVLRFDDTVTWKQIFDFGFRPKHLEGSSDNKCISPSQSFWVQFKNRDLKFRVESGRVAFTFYSDDFLNMVWHQGADALSMEDGKRKADEFRKVFDGYIVNEITMPRLIDPNGLVDAGNDENNIKARVGEWLIWYGFDSSMRKDKPIIPHFYMAWIFSGMPKMKPKDVRDVVRPPEGYEWYSLDPKVSTPDPGTEEDGPEKNVTEFTPSDSKPVENPFPKDELLKDAPKEGIELWVWILLLITGLSIALRIWKKRSQAS